MQESGLRESHPGAHAGEEFWTHLSRQAAIAISFDQTGVVNKQLLTDRCLFLGFAVKHVSGGTTGQAFQLFDGTDGNGVQVGEVQVAQLLDRNFWLGPGGVRCQRGLFIATLTASARLRGGFYVKV